MQRPRFLGCIDVEILSLFRMLVCGTVTLGSGGKLH